MDFPRIHQLSEEVIGQIAAGEVVERPASAIKELIENAMDAGATAISVDIRDGGISYLKVTDNGKGILPQDVRLAFARHATSKIASAGDIYGVRTLGFRGEALASIAAVARVQLTTRTKAADSGVTVINEGGVISRIDPSACPEGTQITVQDLFYNAPVRRKFLKKPAFEAAAVSELLAALIISHPEISFRFRSDGKTVYFSAGDGKIDSAVLCVFGLDVLKGLTKIEGFQNGLILNGYVGTGELARGNRSKQYFFLNGRLMKSPLLTGALENACRQRVMIGRFPICMLYLTIPYENVDVNVHPNKWEVRFSDEKGVRSAVENIISDVMSKQGIFEKTPSLFSQPPQYPDAGKDARPAADIVVSSHIQAENAANESTDKIVNSAVDNDISLHRFVTSTPVPVSKPVVSESIPAFIPEEEPPGREAEPDKPAVPPVSVMTEAVQQQAFYENDDSTAEQLQYIGVVFNTYILLAYGDKMLFCDQHAAHERILYERLLSETKQNGILSQELLMPLLITLSPARFTLFSENLRLLHEAGFDAEAFGDYSVKLKGVPVILGQPEAEKCFIDAIDELAQTGSYSEPDRISRLMQTACKHAIKGGEKVPENQLTHLIQDILEAKIPPTCPHGRPLFIEVSRRDLEKRFKRIQDA